MSARSAVRDVEWAIRFIDPRGFAVLDPELHAIATLARRLAVQVDRLREVVDGQPR